MLERVTLSSVFAIPLAGSVLAGLFYLFMAVYSLKNKSFKGLLVTGITGLLYGFSVLAPAFILKDAVLAIPVIIIGSMLVNITGLTLFDKVINNSK